MIFGFGFYLQILKISRILSIRAILQIRGLDSMDFLHATDHPESSYGPTDLSIWIRATDLKEFYFPTYPSFKKMLAIYWHTFIIGVVPNMIG